MSDVVWEKPHFCSDIWYRNWLKACYYSRSLPCLYWYQICYCLRSYQPGSVLNTNLNTTCKSTHTRPTLVTTCKMQTGWEIIVTHNAVFRTHRCRDCFGHILSTKVYVSYLSAIMIGNKQLPLYHVIYITACEGICSYLSVFGFATCITSSCTLVAKRVEVVPCYTCYYYYYVKAFCFFPLFFFCILFVMTTERSF